MQGRIDFGKLLVGEEWHHLRKLILVGGERGQAENEDAKGEGRAAPAGADFREESSRRGAPVTEWCRDADPEQDDEGQQQIEDQQPLRSQCREVGFREQGSRDTSVAKAEDRQFCR
ncbi:hypothetical protein [Mesorhizobium sp. M1252]|uniref:hypothetical protein n=1 Tax=Mesorhizobium sp. M1252 TaxID=2957073 RepID=UPI0033399FFE